MRAPFAGIASNTPQLGQQVIGNAAFSSPVMSLVADTGVWIEANFKETDLTHVRPGQPVAIHVDTYPDHEWHGTVESLSQATGAEFSVIPPQNATGNWVKVVQRIPVRIALETNGHDPALRAGMSATVEIDTGHRRPLPGFVRTALSWFGVSRTRRRRGGCSADDDAAAESTPLGRGLITVSIMLATIMQALDTTIANVALPHMQGSMSATQDQISWVLTSYIVAAAIMTPLTGVLAARFGRKRLFAIMVIGFTVASMLCGAATSLAEIVLFRLLQGAFGAGLVPLSQAVLLDTYPREKHGSAMAMWGVGVMVGPILGPTLGGYLTEFYNWRWVFYINLPFGILALLGILAFVPETARDRRALRLLRLRAPEPRDRRPADDARPRRVAGLVRLDRDRGRGGARGALPLHVPGAHVHGRASRSSSRACSRTATSRWGSSSSSWSAWSCSPRSRCCRRSCRT